MKEKWTPGTWIWHTSNSLRRLTSYVDGKYQQDGNVLHAHVTRDACPDISVSEADMYLISASPEMFDACVAALDRLAQLGPAHQDVCRTLAAAIDKARGAPNDRH